MIQQLWYTMPMAADNGPDVGLAVVGRGDVDEPGNGKTIFVVPNSKMVNIH